VTSKRTTKRGKNRRVTEVGAATTVEDDRQWDRSAAGSDRKSDRKKKKKKIVKRWARPRKA
jgi:hypothetical protein